MGLCKALGSVALLFRFLTSLLSCLLYPLIIAVSSERPFSFLSSFDTSIVRFLFYFYERWWREIITPLVGLREVVRASD